MNCLACNTVVPDTEFMCVECFELLNIKPTSLFKTLTETEEKEYRQYALENSPPNMAEWEIYHPICREVWISRGIQP